MNTIVFLIGIVIVLIALLAYALIALNTFKTRCTSLEEELASVKARLEKFERKSSEHEKKVNEPYSRSVKKTHDKSLNDPIAILQTNQVLRAQSKFTTNSRTDNVKVDVEESAADTTILNESTTIFQDSPTLLDTTRIINESREQRQLGEMLATYRVMIGNVHIEDIKVFCQKYNVSGAKRRENAGSAETVLELLDDEISSDSNIWVTPYGQSGRYNILAGSMVSLNFKVLSADNARLISDIFRNVMVITSGNKFDVIEPGIAEKRGNGLTVIKLGKLSFPT